MAAGLIEHTVMTNLRREYEAQGYDFYESPPPEAVPDFLGKFRPDAIAIRGDEGVVLELTPRTVGPDALNYIAERFEGHPRWRFRVIVYDPKQDEISEEPEVVDLRDLRNRVQKLRDDGEVDAALLLAWATLEAVFRSKSSNSGRRTASSTLQIAEILEHLGVVSGDQASLLRQSASVRNWVAHGRFDMRPGTGLINVALEVAEDLNRRKGKVA